MTEAARRCAGMQLLSGVVMVQQERAGRGDETLDIFQLLAALRRGWMIILLTTLAFAGLAAAYALSVAPVYRATAEVLILPRQKNLFNNAPLGQVMASDILLVESQARLAVSDTVLERVVEELGLQRDGEFNGQQPSAGALVALKRLLGSGAEREAATDARLAALRALRKRVEARRAAKTFVLEISAESRDARKAARLANAVARAFIAEQAAAMSGEAGKLARQLDERLDQLRREVEEAEARVAAYRQRHGIVATRDDQLETQARLARLGEELVKARTRMAAARARHEGLQQAIRANALEALPEALSSPVLARLRAEHARAASAHSALRETLGPRHPRLLTVKAEMERLERLVREELRRLAARVRGEYETARAEVEAIERNLQRLRARTSQTGLAEVRLRALEREAAARRKVFESFLLKARETGEAQRIKLADARLISPALTPEYPARPRKKLIVGLAGLVGLGLGMALAVLGDAARRRRRTRDAASMRPGQSRPERQAARAAAPGAALAEGEVARMTSTPAPRATEHTATSARGRARPRGAARDGGGEVAEVAVAPVSRRLATLPPLGGARVVPLGRALELAAQALSAHAAQPGYAFGRQVRRLLPAVEHARMIAVMGGARGQGASLLAYALALALARRERRVLLVDGDASRAGLSESLVHGRAPVEEVLSGRMPLEALMCRHVVARVELDVLPLALLTRRARGARMNDPALRRALAEMLARHDCVVLDNPPPNEQARDLGLAEMVDAAVLVAAPGLLRHARVAEVAALLRAAGIGIGVVCNEGVEEPRRRVGLGEGDDAWAGSTDLAVARARRDERARRLAGALGVRAAGRRT